MQFTINMVNGKHLHINKVGYSLLHIPFKQPPAHKVSTVYLLCIYCVPTLHLLCLSCVSTVYLMCTYCLCTVYLLCIYRGSNFESNCESSFDYNGGSNGTMNQKNYESISICIKIFAFAVGLTSFWACFFWCYQ